jgi:CTP synthase (UTP-ammonia lyase)
MTEQIKIAIVGDFNFTYNSHHATNLALEHSCNLLEVELNQYWLRIHEAAALRPHQFLNYDAILVAPGPYENVFFLSGIMDAIIQLEIPVLITGDAYKSFVEVLIVQNNLNGQNEKLISDNLSPRENFEKIEVMPNSKEFIKMYNNMARIELTSSRFSLYPQLLTYLTEKVIDVEAVNQFEDAEIISLKNHHFCVASMSLPQICSTREMPHPLISSFLNIAARLNSDQRKVKVS